MARLLYLVCALFVSSASSFTPMTRMQRIAKGSVSKRTPLMASAGAFVTTPIRGLGEAGASRVLVAQSRRALGASSMRMSLFGLGGPEIAIIIAVGALLAFLSETRSSLISTHPSILDCVLRFLAGFVLGPEKLSSMARDFGKVPPNRVQFIMLAVACYD